MWMSWKGEVDDHHQMAECHILDQEEPMRQICKETRKVSMGSEQMVERKAHATIMRSSFGIKSFYPKIGGHVLTPKFGSRRKDPKVEISQKKAETFNQIS